MTSTDLGEFPGFEHVGVCELNIERLHVGGKGQGRAHGCCLWVHLRDGGGGIALFQDHHEHIVKVEEHHTVIFCVSLRDPERRFNRRSREAPSPICRSGSALQMMSSSRGMDR